jgi:glycosyltransferase involved in cell wall biosynthesis
MKIVIDVGVLGLAQLFETARTGIYRVVSNLTLELLAREDLDLSFSSLSSLQVNQLTVQYLEDSGSSGRAFPDSLVEKTLAGLGNIDLESPQVSFATKVLSRLCRISRVRRIGRAADLYHSHYLPLPEFKSAGTPVKMLTIYDIIPLIHPEYFDERFVDDFKSIMASFSPEKDFLFTISECTKRDLCSWFDMDPERIFVTPLAAANDLYHPVQDKDELAKVRTKFAIPDGRYFLTLATVEKRKNLKMSIDCFRKVAREPGNEDLCFVLVGTRGWKVKELMEEIESDSFLQNRVIFTGFVADKYLSALYSGAEAFLYPSLYEGFGLPPLEAMQCGLPVITSDSSSLPEVVGDAGLLVDPTDKDGICEAMLTLLNDTDMHREFRKKGIERASQFSWSNCADATVAGYTQAWNQR